MNNSFRAAMEAAGLPAPANIIADGTLHRFHVSGDRPRSENGWYVLHDDDPLAAAFGCWKRGISETWCDKPTDTLAPAEKTALQARIKAVHAERERAQTDIQAKARKRAQRIWDAAEPAPADHPYLVKKGIQALGLRVSQGSLVIPLRDATETLVGLQFIAREGGKRYLTGTAKRGAFFIIGDKPIAGLILYLCEGFATGSSIHQATGAPVVVAFDSGNLPLVAEGLRKEFPDQQIVICGDNDAWTEGNPGAAKAKEAAASVNGRVALPTFQTATEKPTDFNDLHHLEGLEEVRLQIEAVISQSKPPRESDSQTIARLAALPLLEYDRLRKEQAEALGVQLKTLDREVAAARKESTDQSDPFEEVEPWSGPVDPAELLTMITTTIMRFIVCAKETAVAATLWIAMTWFIDELQVAPIAAITAPEKRCGKSLLLFVLKRLVRRALIASNVSPAALFRAVDAWRPTLLIDEADTFVRDNDELRGLLNCGHTRDSAFVIRVAGEDHTPTKFNAWGAKALAGIGRLADTLMDRSVNLELRRKLPHETVERLRHAEPGLFEALTSQLARFAEDYYEAVRSARPDIPSTLNDRAQDNWEPLLAIADVAGGPWPEMARQAAIKISGSENPQNTVGTELLTDIQEIFAQKKVDRISTANLIEALCADEERPWATYNRGRSISPRQVASRLKEYGIASRTVRIGYDTPKGFLREQFEEAWARYLSPPGNSATTPQAHVHAGLSVANDLPRCATATQKETSKLSDYAGCGGVADNSPLTEGDSIEATAEKALGPTQGILEFTEDDFGEDL